MTDPRYLLHASTAPENGPTNRGNEEEEEEEDDNKKKNGEITQPSACGHLCQPMLHCITPFGL